MSIEAMKLALEHIEGNYTVSAEDAIKALEKALKQEQGEPVAVVTGVYGGRFTYAPIKESVVLPVGMALYTLPQHRKWVDLTGEELETLLSENRALTLGAIWAVSNKLKEKNT